MTAQLPRPGSIWHQPSTGRTMRVILSGPTDIVCHDCELADRMPACVEPVSWRGNPEEFFGDFLPANPDGYPKTVS